MAKTKKEKLGNHLNSNFQKSPKRRNLNDSLINTVQQLCNHLSVLIIKVQKGRNLHDSLINMVQQLHNHLSVSIIKVQKKEVLMIPSLTQCNSYIIIYQFQLLKSKQKGELTNQVTIT